MIRFVRFCNLGLLVLTPILVTLLLVSLQRQAKATTNTQCPMVETQPPNVTCPPNTAADQDSQVDGYACATINYANGTSGCCQYDYFFVNCMGITDNIQYGHYAKLYCQDPISSSPYGGSDGTPGKVCSNGQCIWPPNPPGGGAD